MAKIPVYFPRTKPDANQVEISAETAAFLGMSISSRPTVDEALIAAVLTAGNACRVNVTVTVGGKAATAGMQVNGIKTLTGGVCYTDSAGKVMGLSSQATATISTIAYVDINAVSKSVSTPAQGTVNVTLELAAPINNTVRTYESSGNVIFSPYVTGVDVCCIGAGGKGGDGGRGGHSFFSYPGSGEPITAGSSGGGGGGGGSGGGTGQVLSATDISVVPLTQYNLTVGQNGGSTNAFGFTAVGGINGTNGGYGEGANLGKDLYFDQATHPGGYGGVSSAVPSGEKVGGNGGRGGNGTRAGYIGSTNNGEAGGTGTTGSVKTTSYWGGTITQTSGAGGSGGGGGSGNNAGGESRDVFTPKNGTGGNSGSNTFFASGGASVSVVCSNSGNTLLSGTGGTGAAPIIANAASGGGGGGSGGAVCGNTSSDMVILGGPGGAGGTIAAPARLGSGGAGGGGSGGAGGTRYLNKKSVASDGTMNGGSGQTALGAVMIRIHV